MRAYGRSWAMESRRQVTPRSGMPLLITLLCLAAASCADSSNGNSDDSSQLRTNIKACTTTGPSQQTLVAVGFGSTTTTPAAVEDALPISRLWSFDYQEGSGGGPIHVGGFPLPTGSIDLLPPSKNGASADSSPPPKAELPIMGDGERLTLTNLLMGIEKRTLIEADSVMALEGKSADTPLGRVTVRGISSDNEAINVHLQFEWDESLRGAEFLPKGSLLAQVSIGRVRTSADGPSYTLNGSGRQSFDFLLTPAERHGQATIILDQFGLLYPGPLMVDPNTHCD